MRGQCIPRRGRRVKNVRETAKPAADVIERIKKIRRGREIAPFLLSNVISRDIYYIIYAWVKRERIKNKIFGKNKKS